MEDLKLYSINENTKWEYLYKPSLITFSVHFAGALCILLYKDVGDVELYFFVILAVTLAWFIFFMFPLLLLYINHMKISKFIKFTINEEGNCSYISKTESKYFHIEEIKKIDLWLSPPSYDERTDFLYFGKYHFTTIHLDHNQLINISCLVFDQTTTTFPSNLIKRRKKIMPFMAK